MAVIDGLPPAVRLNVVGTAALKGFEGSREVGGGRCACIYVYISRRPFKMFKTFKRCTVRCAHLPSNCVLNVLNILNGCPDRNTFRGPSPHF